MITYEELEFGDDEPEDVFKRMSASEFYFDVDIDDRTVVIIVPKVFWDKEEYLYDQCRGLDHILPPYITYVNEICDAMWSSSKSLEQTTKDMIELGFVHKPGIGEPQ